MNTVEAIADRAADIFNTTRKDILSRSRRHEHILARHAVQYVAGLAGKSSTVVADRMGFDPATVTYGRRKLKARIAVDQDYAERVKKLAEVVA